MNRRIFFAWLMQLLPQPPRALQQLPVATCPLGHTQPIYESSFSANTLICRQCGIYFHTLPLG
jgi:hypothetical protein